ncbi:T-complex protein 1 subunit delta-like [Schistocerca gregaria]|uniref:T-complex protein 1 subunit delta-like n=1 Tax=Schistocerca gregaria TaxID=7010 RepID=UPI00211E4A75|nr:T-complex protein 1 subunit delta-like [Schistocerca gregaria]
MSTTVKPYAQPAGKVFADSNTRQKEVRSNNIAAAKSVAEAIRTSLGPKGMDKMIINSNNEVIISNDGATILKQMEVVHPIAKMLVELSLSQDIEAGDGTTTVTVLAGSILNQCQCLLNRNFHPQIIADGIEKAASLAIDCLKSISKPVLLLDREALIKNAKTSLSSKIVSQYSSLLAPLAVDAIYKVIDPNTATNVDLNDIRIVKKPGGTIDDTELVDGFVFDHACSHAAGGPTHVENAKIGLIQFQLSAPKTNIENQIVINQYAQIDRVLREERKYILDMCKRIKSTGCNVLLIQKSILRDAVSDLSLQYLAKMNILVVKDVERSDIEFISKTVGAIPIASSKAFVAAKLGTADLVEEVHTSDGNVVKITGVPNAGKTVSILVRGGNKLVIDEVERSLHDALCVVRSVVKSKHLIVGGGAPEIEMAIQLEKRAEISTGVEPYCFRAFAEALETIPYTLAENAGLNPIAIVTELRNRHALGETNTGINIRKGAITDMESENVVQPLIVTTSAIKLATETACMILRLDDMIECR